MRDRKHPLAHCGACPYGGSDREPVLGTSPDGRVKLAIVGEAPGFHEDAVGRPFVGTSGKILNEVLRNNDIRRDDCLVTNAVACRPPDNDTPPASAIEACKPRLLAELAEHAPEYILATGAVAAQALGLKGGVKNLRVGPPREHVLTVTDTATGESVDIVSKVVTTWHPAYAARFPDALPTIDLDVSKITKGTIPTTWRQPDLVVADDIETARLAVLDLWDMPGPFSVDIETGYDKDDGEFHAEQQGLLCIGICYEKDKVVVFGRNVVGPEHRVFLDELAKLLREKALGMHNGKSDVAGLYASMGPVNLKYDTLLAHYVLDERTGGHRLEELGVELVGVPPWKHMTKPYLAKGGKKNFADIPDHVLYPYNAIDCSVTFYLMEMLLPQIEAQGRMALHDHLVAAGNQLVYPEMDGIGFDMPYSLELTGQLQDEISQNEGRMQDLLGLQTPINPRSPQQLINLFHTRGWVVPEEKRRPTTNAKALTVAREAGAYDHDPDALAFLDLLFENRGLSKDDGTYVRGLQKRAHETTTPEGVVQYRIHTTFTLHVATTGRLSSRDPNLQNIKKNPRLRRQFIAGPGRTFLQGDYSQVEGRVIAVLSKDPYLRELFLNPDRDIFDEISFALYGTRDRSKRTLLKTFFYGLAYGRTAHGIAKDPAFNMDVADAQRQLDAFKSLIPEVDRWQEETWQTVQDQGYLQTTFGRRRHFPLITNGNKDDVKKEALAFVPQSTASDICLSAFIGLRPRLEEVSRGEARILVTVHDSLMAEAPATKTKVIESIMQAHMELAGEQWAASQGSDIPFAVAFKQGTSWDQLD